jgi:molybdopterin-guanine dinucleotide biosynthesis protein A
MDLEAYILIGGRSARFGADKAFVEFEGQTFASRAVSVIGSALAPKRITFVTSSNNAIAPDRLLTLERSVISDSKPGYGAWSGLEAALCHAGSEWAFVSACDLPFVSVALLKLMADRVDDETEAVVARQQNERIQPLCAFYRVKPALVVVSDIVNGETALPPLNAIFDRLRTRVIEADEYAHLTDAEKLFLNMNTPADLAATEQPR